MTDKPVKTRAQSTPGLAAIKAELAKSRLESRRSRTQDGTPLSYSAIKGNNIAKTKNPRESRSFSNPDISGSLAIFSDANGLFKKALNTSTFKTDSRPINLQMPEERPVFISEKSTKRVKNLSCSLEEISSSEFGISKQHMAEFANPLHKGNQPRFRKGGGVMSSKPALAPKPVVPPKPPFEKQPLNINNTEQNKNSSDSRSPSQSIIDNGLKKTVENARERFEAKIESSSQSDLVQNMNKNSTEDVEVVCVRTNSLLCSTNDTINNTFDNSNVSTIVDSDLSATLSRTESVNRNAIKNTENSNSLERNTPSKISPLSFPGFTSSCAKAFFQERSKNDNKDRTTTVKSVFYDNGDEDDDGTYAKISHIKPSAPSHPPPRKPPPIPTPKTIQEKHVINNKEETTNINETQHKQLEIESKEDKAIPLYAQVDKSKKKPRSSTQNMNPSPDENLRKSRSVSDPSSNNINLSTKVLPDTPQDVETIKHSMAGNDIDDVSESDSDEGWDPNDFDDDDSSEFEREEESLGENLQGDMKMVSFNEQ